MCVCVLTHGIESNHANCPIYILFVFSCCVCVYLRVLLALQNKNMPDNLTGVQRRFVMFGGGVSEEQLGWLEQELQVGGAW